MNESMDFEASESQTDAFHMIEADRRIFDESAFDPFRNVKCPDQVFPL
jgi:hypothetical protein